MNQSLNMNTLWDQHLNHVLTNYHTQLEQQGFEALMVHAGVSSRFFLDDNHAPFRANPIFTHCVPNLLQAENAWVLLLKNQRPVLCLHQPEDFWYGKPEQPEGDWCQDYDIHTFADERAQLSFIAQLAGGLNTAAIVPNVAPVFTQMLEQSTVNPPSLIDGLHRIRLIKSEWEIEQIAMANRVSAKGHAAAHNAFLTGGTEHEIHMAYLCETKALDEELPYNAIVALNEHAAVLHYPRKTRDQEALNKTLLIDAGNTYHGYASDITRTYLHFDCESCEGYDAFKALLDGVERLQTTMAKTLTAGNSYLVYHLEMHKGLFELLVETGIVSSAPENESDQMRISKTFFPHGLGHHLGIQTHDVGAWQRAAEIRDHLPPHPESAPDDHPFLRMAGKLEAGMVITLEPGLYFIPTLLDQLHVTSVRSSLNWSLIESLIPYGGIRIEDNIVITENEPRNLTREAFEHPL